MKTFNSSRPKKTSVTEHLTNYNLNLLSTAKDKIGKNNVWTSKCKIFTKHKGNQVQIKTENDVTEILANQTISNSYPLSADVTLGPHGKILPGTPTNALEEAMRMLNTNAKKSRNRPSTTLN